MSAAALVPPALRVGQVLRAFLPEYLRTHALPAPLRPWALQNPALLYALLFEAASATLRQFGQERFGAVLGITAILHTWGRNLMDHPHLHGLVTGGGLTAQNTWAGPKQVRWLLDVHAVAAMFEGKFSAGLLQRHATGQLQFHGKREPLREAAAFAQFLRQLREKKWNLFAKGSVAGADAVLNYLGRYTHRVALADGRGRTLDAAAQTVTFAYKDYADADRRKEMTLTGDEFVRRFCLHLLPAGFTKIRHYGLLGNNARKKCIPQARAALENSPWRFAPKAIQAAPTPAPPQIRRGQVCPFCQSRELPALARISGRGGIVWSRLPLAQKFPRPPPDTS